MTSDRPDDQETADRSDRDRPTSTRGKQRRLKAKEPRKGISVRLTYAEWLFLKAASDQLGVTFAVLLRDSAIKEVEAITDLRLSDFEGTEPPD